jgi:hypothetical protein
MGGDYLEFRGCVAEEPGPLLAGDSHGRRNRWTPGRLTSAESDPDQARDTDSDVYLGPVVISQKAVPLW